MITPEQAQQELERRKVLRSGKVPSDIISESVTPAPVAPVPSQPISGWQQPQQSRNMTGQEPTDNQLLEELGEEIPKPITKIGPLTNFPREQRRMNAYWTLLKKGYTQEDIQNAIRIKTEFQPSMAKQIWQTKGEIIGATAGGIIGGPGIATAAIAAGAGGLLGKAIDVALAEGRLATPGELTKSAVWNAILEGGTRGGQAEWRAWRGKMVTPKVFTPRTPGLWTAGQQLTKEQAAQMSKISIEEVQKELAGMGLSLTPAQINNRLRTKIAQGWALSNYIGKEIAGELLQDQTNIGFKGIANKAVDKIAGDIIREDPESLGLLFSQAISKTPKRGFFFQAVDDYIDPLYKEISDASANAPLVSVKGINNAAKEILEQNARLEGIPLRKAKDIFERSARLAKPKTGEIGKDAQEILDMIRAGKTGAATPKQIEENITVIMGQAAQQGGKLSVEDTRFLRSIYISIKSGLKRDAPQAEQSINKLVKAADDAIFDAAEDEGLPLAWRQQLRNVNAEYKAIQEHIEKVFPEQLADTLTRAPTGVLDSVFSVETPQRAMEIKEGLMNLWGKRESPEGKVLWEQLRAGWLAKRVRESSPKGYFDPRIFVKQIEDLGETAKVMLSPEDVKTLGKVYTTSKIMIVPPSTGGMVGRGVLQAGGGLILYGGIKTGQIRYIMLGGTLLFEPIGYAYAMVHAPKLLGRTQTLMGILEKRATDFAKTPEGKKAIESAAKELPVVIARLVKTMASAEQKEENVLQRAKYHRQYQEMQIEPTSKEQLSGFGGRGY